MAMVAIHRVSAVITIETSQGVTERPSRHWRCLRRGRVERGRPEGCPTTNPDTHSHQAVSYTHLRAHETRRHL
eukprot:1387920-Prorocentrum_lima.AAC.1